MHNGPKLRHFREGFTLRYGPCTQLPFIVRWVTVLLMCQTFISINDTTSMPSKNTIRVREARRRRERLTKQPVRINVPVELRTLKRSTRKQIERERAPSLWIMPWIDYTHAGGHKGRVYPSNHLLGLPTEIRQNIIYHTYSMAEVEADTRDIYWDKQKPAKNGQKSVSHRRNSGTRGPQLSKTMQKSLRETIDVSKNQSKLVTILSRRIGALKCVSPLIQTEMEYVGKRWQEDLETHIQRKLKVQLHELAWLLQPDIESCVKPKQGQVVKAKKHVPGKRKRHMKCWYCTERHGRDDKTCPLARRNLKEWEKMTKKVSGWRGREQDKLRSQMEAKKVVFE